MNVLARDWQIARARAQELLGRRFDPSQPRDEHGRWMDAGGSDDSGNAPQYDTAKVEAKTKLNVAAASERARENGQEPMPGSKAEHPATIASRNPTAVKVTATPKGHYGQPDVATMKLEPERYAHDIGLFSNDDFYPNFRADDFKDGTDAAVGNIVGQLKDNLKFLYGFADKHTQVWYDGARALVDDRAALWGFNDASVAAVYAALSPTKDWDQNVHIADMLLKTYKTQQAHRWDDMMTKKARGLWSKDNQKLVKLVKGKTLGELTDPAHKAIWIRTYDETHNKSEYRVVQPNGAMGPVARNLDGGTKKVVWQSLTAIKNAVIALEANGDRDKISAAMGTAHKVRSFYNNILDPHSANGDVTIDTHAVGAALLRQLSNSTVAVAHNFGNTPMKVDQPEGWDAAGSSSKTGLSGLYPVYAQAYREAAAELGIQPRQLQSAVWVVKRNTFGELPKASQEAVEALWHSYHDDHSVTLEHTRSEIAKILGLGKHERHYRPAEGSRDSGDAGELHRGELGPAVADVDSGAGDGVTGGAAGLDAVRSEERRVGTEVELVARDAHSEWMDECVPKLMDYGKDQITAVAACLNMWRTAWEESHPDGADDPGPDRPTTEEGDDKPMRRRALALLKAYNEADHPRDDHGRWTDGGGSDDSPTPERPPSHARATNAATVKAIGKDINHPNLSALKEAVDRGAWKLTVDKVREGYSQKITEIGIHSPVPGNWKQHTNPTGSVRYYDPDKAAPDADGYIAPKVDTEAALPKTATPGVIYRGMSYEEYQAALKSGEFASRGGYNLGQEQVGLTYYSSEVDQAVSYAHGFAPWQYKAVPGRPAVVIGIADPGGHIVNEHQPTELGLDKPVPVSELREVYFGDPIIAQSGYTEVVQEGGRPPMQGSGTSPSNTVAWRREGVTSARELAVPDRHHPGEGYSPEAYVANGVIYTNNVYDAQRALYEDRAVELEQPRTLSVLLDKLGAVTKDMIEKGEKAPTFNLCRVTIKGTSLFCADSQGIPRAKMPQIAEGQEMAFRDFLAAKGYKVEEQEEHASYLRATQNELNGAKIARMAAVIQRDGRLDAPPIFASRDSYILDGHHRWASEIGVDAANNVLADSKKMAIVRVDASITQLLHEAELFTGGKGKLSVEDERLRRLAALLAKRFDPAQERDEYGRWTDGGGSDAPSGYTDEQVAAAMSAAFVKPMAEATATQLDFNPELIEYSDEDKAFTVGDATYKYAGSYTFGSNKITLYKPHLGASNVRGVTAHEIGHRKFELLLKARLVEAAAVMKEPGPPPDPEHRYWWGRKGGSDAVMTPDGTLRAPYDKKYPLYEEWQQIQNMRPSLEQDDGITDYSKAYWKEWEKGKLNTELAYHETMAEIARAQAIGGKHAKGTGKGWQRLFALQEKVWAETDKVERDTPRGPLKAIWVLDGVRWEIR